MSNQIFPYTNHSRFTDPEIFVSGNNDIVYNKDGKQYFDCNSGLTLDIIILVMLILLILIYIFILRTFGVAQKLLNLLLKQYANTLDIVEYSLGIVAAMLLIAQFISASIITANLIY